MKEKFQISFIGSGNVATHLAPALDNAGHLVIEVFSRKKSNAENLVKKLYSAEIKNDLNFSESPSEIFIIAVNDGSIAEVAKEIVLPDNAILVHTSGSEPLSSLSFAASTHSGVFYPVQTFSKSRKISFGNVPVCIEGTDDYTREILTYLANGITETIHYLSSEDRKAMHIAAVFACNFTNHLLTISNEILSRQNIQYKILEPLIVETINKSLQLGPENAQTGPAARGDTKIISDHMNQLQYNENYMNIYRLISQSIMNYSLQKDDNIEK